MLRERVDRLDAVLLTHEHNDHIIGIDDVRPYNFAQAVDMPLYGLSRVLTDLKDRFRYAFEGGYPGAPRLAVRPVEPWEAFDIGDITVTPLPIEHGKLDILGYMLGEDVVYITDASALTDRVRDTIRGKELVILNALHHRKHHSHFTLAEAVEALEEIKPRQAYITHISHYMGLHDSVNEDLPSFIRLGYDGLRVTVN
jgi:phosphoribosyl 1,2-cyclic phosphate phosphodiesterase